MADAWTPWRALATQIIRRAVDDLAAPGAAGAEPGRTSRRWYTWHAARRRRADALDFLTHRLWQPGNVWGEWLSQALDRRIVLREIRFALGESDRCPRCRGDGMIGVPGPRELRLPGPCPRCGSSGEIARTPGRPRQASNGSGASGASGPTTS